MRSPRRVRRGSRGLLFGYALEMAPGFYFRIRVLLPESASADRTHLRAVSLFRLVDRSLRVFAVSGIDRINRRRHSSAFANVSSDRAFDLS